MAATAACYKPGPLRCYKGMVAAITLSADSQRTFEQFFMQEYPRAVSVAFRITRDCGEAEDVAQEVFVKCARSHRYAKPGAEAWVHAAAVHTALNAVRARKRRMRREAHLEHQPDEPAPEPHALLERSVDRDRVRAALLRMRPLDALLLALRYGGLSYRECADALSLAPAQIGTRLARAERAFKQEITRETS